MLDLTGLFALLAFSSLLRLALSDKGKYVRSPKSSVAADSATPPIRRPKPSLGKKGCRTTIANRGMPVKF